MWRTVAKSEYNFHMDIGILDVDDTEDEAPLLGGGMLSGRPFGNWVSGPISIPLFYIPASKRYATTESLSTSFAPKCTCGSDAIKSFSGHHCDWCSKYTGNWNFKHE
jgi:hypothetical protein